MASYGGASFDPVKNGNELSSALVKNASSTYEHTYNDGINKFKSIIKSAQ